MCVVFAMSSGQEWSMGMIGGPVRGFGLVDLEGKEHRLSEHRGKVVILFFWTGCREAACAKGAIQPVQDIYDKFYGKGFVLLTIFEDFHSNLETPPQYLKQYGFTFPVPLTKTTRLPNSLESSTRAPQC